MPNKDDFWDLSSLVPKKRPPVMHRQRDVDTVEIEIDVPPIVQQKSQTAPALSARFREVGVSDVNGAGGSGGAGSVSADANASIGRTVNANVRNANVNVNANVNANMNANVSVNVSNVRNISNIGERGVSGQNADKLRLPPRESVARAHVGSSEPILEYEPEHGFIKRVRVMQWPSRYSFYEQFRFDAKKYKNVVGQPCAEVDFFSYTPQYRQMSRPQIEYYFWWRENVRKGTFLPASFSYVLLYIYEIINLREEMDPSSGVEMMCRIWLAYRDKYRVLDKYLSEWVADYCLISELPAPRELLAPIMHEIIEKYATLREFYMTEDDVSIASLCEFLPDYKWRKSKFASSEEYSALYEKHMNAAISTAAGIISTGEMRLAVVSRDAFCGSLCAHNVKCRIDIEYLSCARSRDLRLVSDPPAVFASNSPQNSARSRDLRSTLTELVKYTENKLRVCLGIRARLHVGELPDNIKSLIDNYFAREFPAVDAKMSRSNGEDSFDESAYEALSAGIDAESAAEIERTSWASTELLTDTESAAALETEKETEQEKVTLPAPNDVESDSAIPVSNDGDGIYSHLDADAAEFLRLVLEGGGADAQSRFCRERGIYADEIASRVNDAAVDVIGDIVLESADGCYAIVEDYRAEIE